VLKKIDYLFLLEANWGIKDIYTVIKEEKNGL